MAYSERSNEAGKQTYALTGALHIANFFTQPNTSVSQQTFYSIQPRVTQATNKYTYVQQLIG